MFGFAFGALFDTAQLMTPEALEDTGPLVQGANGISVSAIEHTAPVAANVDKAHVAKDTKMLGDGGLLKAEGVHDITDGAFIESQKGEDVAATWFGDGVEGVGCGSRTSHGATIHTHMGICQAFFPAPKSQAGRGSSRRVRRSWNGLKSTRFRPEIGARECMVLVICRDGRHVRK